MPYKKELINPQDFQDVYRVHRYQEHHLITYKTIQISLRLEEVAHSGVLRMGSHLFIVSTLLLQPQCVIIESSIGIVKIGKFGHVGYSFMGLLEDGNTDSNVVCRPQELPLLVPEVLLPDVEEELRVEGPQVTGDEGIPAVGTVLDDSLREGARVARPALQGQEVGVHEVESFFLELGVEELQHLPAQQLVIAVHNHEDVIGLAEVDGSEAKVVHGAHLLLVSDDLVPLLGEHLLLAEKAEDEGASAVSGGIVDHYHVVVGVVLHHH